MSYYVSVVPYAALCVTRHKGGEAYYIRFSPAVTKAFDGAKFCYVKRTVDGEYIVIRTVTKPIHEIIEKPWIYRLREQKNATYLSCTGLVNDRFLKRQWFDGRHCKVKKDSKGNVYICINDIVKKEGDA